MMNFKNILKSLRSDSLNNKDQEAKVLFDFLKYTKVKNPLSFFYHVTQYANIWISIQDTSGNIIFWNKTAEELSGFKAYEVLGKNSVWSRLYPDEAYRDETVLNIKKLSEQKRSLTNLKSIILSKEGETKCLLWSYQFEKDDDNNIGYVIVTGIDNTSQWDFLNRLEKSEAKFRSLIEQSPVCIQLHDKKGNLLYVNPAWNTLWQTENGNKLYNSYNILEDNQLKQFDIEGKFQKALNGEIVHIEPYRFIPEDSGFSGRPRWIVSTIYPLKDLNGFIINLVIMHQDHSEYLEAKKSLEEVYFLNDCLLEAIPDYLYVLDKDGNPVENLSRKRVERVLPVKEHLNDEIPDLIFNKSTRDIFKSKIAETIESKKIVKFDYDITNLNLEMYLEARLLPGGNDEVIALIRDNTDIVKTKQQILETQKIDSLGSLASGIAHDYNNMLAGIAGNASFLLDKETDPKKAKYLQNILKAVDFSKDLTEKLLSFSRKSSPVKEWLNINEIIKDLYLIINRTTTAKIDYEFHYESKLPLIKAVPSRIKQVFLNLMINAYEALTESKGKIIISTKLVEINSTELSSFIKTDLAIAISIKDNGEGISEKNIKNIFNPFFTTKGNREKKGTGLGLSTVYGIVRENGGYIKVNSKEGEGAEFLVYFPVIQDLSIKLKTINDSDNCKKIISKSKICKILIADDEDIIREILTEMLLELNCSVVACKDGKDAVRKYKELSQEIDLVILDYQMPGFDGYATLKEMQKINPEVKALISSGLDVEFEPDSFTKNTIIDYLSKPYKFNEISKIISNIFSN